MIDLTGKHIFITGGSRGIGAASARMAAKAGATVSINYHSNHNAANRLVDDITNAGGRALSIAADASEEGALMHAMQTAVEKMGPLNGLVVSAGIFEGLALEAMTVQFWDRVMAVNLRSTFLAVQAAAPHMRHTGEGGSIVIYSSTAGQRGSAIYSAYAASKAAQIMFMRSMAKELGKDKIRVNCIAPSWTETDMAAPSLDELGRDEVVKEFVLGRIGMPDDVAGATMFLLSEVSNFITGTTVTVDGGMDMRG